MRSPHRGDAYAALQAAIKALKPRLQAQVVGILDGSPIDDIARRTGLPRLTVFRRRKRACALLRRALETAGYEWVDFLPPAERPHRGRA